MYTFIEGFPFSTFVGQKPTILAIGTGGNMIFENTRNVGRIQRSADHLPNTLYNNQNKVSVSPLLVFLLSFLFVLFPALQKHFQKYNLLQRQSPDCYKNEYLPSTLLKN